MTQGERVAGRGELTDDVELLAEAEMGVGIGVEGIVGAEERGHRARARRRAHRAQGSALVASRLMGTSHSWSNIWARIETGPAMIVSRLRAVHEPELCAKIAISPLLVLVGGVLARCVAPFPAGTWSLCRADTRPYGPRRTPPTCPRDLGPPLDPRRQYASVCAVRCSRLCRSFSWSTSSVHRLPIVRLLLTPHQGLPIFLDSAVSAPHLWCCPR